MGNEQIRNGRADGRSSLGCFDDKGSFGDAFKAAHSAGGWGHTFSYNDNLYSTNCKDGGDYRKEKDQRDIESHRVAQIGHTMNAQVKDATGIHCQDFLYFTRGYKWSSDVDRQRAEYHRREILKNPTNLKIDIHNPYMDFHYF